MSRRQAVVAAVIVMLLTVLLLVLAPAAAPLPVRETETRRADLEFSFRGATPPEKGEVALSLWETGLVERVAAPKEPSSLYRVYLREPGNLFAMADIHRRLENHDAVGHVWSVVGFISDY